MITADEKIEHAGGEMLRRALGSKNPSEAMKTFKQFQPLIPQLGQAQMDEIREKMKVQENMRKLFEYLRRARA